MKIRLPVFVLVMFASFSCFAQLFYPAEIKDAVERGTRTYNGVPGEKYFQNHSEYTIDAEFNPITGILKGKAEITYFNESPDTLRKVIMRLYQNIYKKGGIRDEQVDPAVINNGVLIKSLLVNHEDYSPKINQRTRTEGTNFTIFLNKALSPGSTCRIDIDWEFTMPDRPVKRFGKYDEGSYFVSLWYPQVAVYDDIDGWDEIQYTGTQEFYNDFNNYYVSITVPRGFMVWATGSWINAQFILSKKTYSRYEKAHTSDTIIQVITVSDLKEKNWFSGKGSKTFRFKADKVPDFAFAVSDRYVWDAVSATINQDQGISDVFVSAAYPDGASYFDRVAETGKEVVKLLSEESYGVPYPYPSVTVFKGEGGMEYPMIVNDGKRFFLDATIFVTMHEIAHAYFPFTTGINERYYSWIDEGLTTYLPMETEKFLGSQYYTMEHVINRYEIMAGSREDIPLSIPAFQTRGRSYENYSYIRSSVAFSMLENLIGRDTFRLAIRNFIEIWKYKHPTPYDLFAVISKTSQRELGWFIEPWFFGFGWPDLAIGDVSLTGNKIRIEVLNRGNFPVPLILTLNFLSEEEEKYSYSAEIWKSKSEVSLSYIILDELKNIVLGSPLIPDKNPSDNIFEIPGNSEP